MQYLDSYIKSIDWTKIPLQRVDVDPEIIPKAIKLLASKNLEDSKVGYALITDNVLDCYYLSPGAYYLIDPIVYILKENLYIELV